MSEEKKRKRGRPPKKNKEENICFIIVTFVDFHGQILNKIEESGETLWLWLGGI